MKQVWVSWPEYTDLEMWWVHRCLSEVSNGLIITIVDDGGVTSLLIHGGFKAEKAFKRDGLNNPHL